ncbi:unnamed protein product [Phytophthora fragariaefolia]|uniref:Unnamed protein product n=1 Tax=Phytophthora fragariaefolia TaxID=1490495 RepID=A0A9W6U7P2_9STRA|nr:unnamed protein product [Phytophthora fragariaefolia]
MPWFTRYQPEIDWLARSLQRRADYDVNEVFTHPVAAPSPHVAVVDCSSTTQLSQRVCDGPRCLTCAATIVEATCGPSSRAREDTRNYAVEQRPPREDIAVEQGLPRVNIAVEQRLPHENIAVDQRIPPENYAVEQRLPLVNASVEQRLQFADKPAVKKPAAKQLPKKDAPKEVRRTSLPPKRTDVLSPGPHEEMTSDSSDTDTPNPALVTGADSPVGDASQAPRAQASLPGPAASATSATTPPPKRSPSPDPSLRVDYKESEPDMDREAGEVEESGSSPPLTDAQRALHQGSPMSPKTVAAIARARALEEALSRRDDPPPATPEPQVITNTGVDERVPPELLRCENRQHLSDRSRQTASQPIGAKRERETPAPRTREQILALGYWTREDSRGGCTTWAIPSPSS